MRKILISAMAILFSAAALWSGDVAEKKTAGKGVKASFTRLDLGFTSQGTRCAAWLYLPAGIDKPPVVIMAHGLGGERTQRLPEFAEKFAERGLACLVFDYRCFGDSEGEPRNYISPSRHLEDWKAAIQYVRGLDQVNSGKIALWGTSFAGGHVIVTAAESKGISAIVAQVPFVDGFSSIGSYDFFYSLKGFFHGLLDAIFAAFTLGHKRHYIKVAGSPDEFAIMNKPDTLEGLKKMLPAEMKSEKKCPAIIAFTAPFYRPIKYADKVACPALIIYAEKDTLIPAEAVKEAAAKIKNAQLVSMPINHFDIYSGPDFEKAVKLEADFLTEQLTQGGI